MKLFDSFQELLLEDFKSQKQRFIQQGFSPEIVTAYLEKFKHIKDKKFKEIGDEIHGVEIPIPQRINIDAYKDFHELERLVDYVGGQRPVSSAMKGDENIEVTGEAIFKDKNFEVYYADNPRACIKYKGKVPYSWCVARADSSNMFYTYRFKPYEPAFYFVKDIKAAEKEFGIWNMTKNVFQGKFKNPYHFFVIQVPKNIELDNVNTQQYIVTSANNDGDEQMSWNDIVALNPNIAPIKDVLKPKPFTPEERKQHERFKNGISDREFSKLTYEEKRNYLDIYPTIARPITYDQLTNLPEDLLNLYVSFGIGLDDAQFEYIKPMGNILKRYKQISERKFEEYMKRDSSYERRQLKLMFTELALLSDENIAKYLNSLSNKDIKKFIHTYGEDKLDFLVKHVPEKVTAETISIKNLLVAANNGDGESLERLQNMVPTKIELSFYRGHIVFDVSNYHRNLWDYADIDSEIVDIYEAVATYNYWADDYSYFEGYDEGQENEYKDYIGMIVKDNHDLEHQFKTVGLDWSFETINELLETYGLKNQIYEYLDEQFSQAQSDAKETAWDKIKGEIKSVIEANNNRGEITIKLGAFISYLSNRNFFTTNDEDFKTNVVNLLEEILDDFDLPVDYNNLREEIDNESHQYFHVNNETIIANIESEIDYALTKYLENTGEGEEGDDPTSNIYRLKSEIINSLNTTLRALGQEPYAKVIENEITKIEIDRSRFKLDGQVYIRFTNKQSGRTEEGYAFIKNIPNYFTNYQAFESRKKFNILEVYDEVVLKKQLKKYVGQCDALRRKCDVNEKNWYQMMQLKQKISFKEFIANVDFTEFLDDEETPKQYINDAKRSDPDTAAYVSKWGDQTCMFLQSAGFEFIFV